MNQRLITIGFVIILALAALLSRLPGRTNVTLPSNADEGTSKLNALSEQIETQQKRIEQLERASSVGLGSSKPQGGFEVNGVNVVRELNDLSQAIRELQTQVKGLKAKNPSPTR